MPIPTNQPIVRDDGADLIYKTEVAKFDAVVDDIAERYETRPAGAGRHDQRREERVPVAAAEEAGHPPRGAERQAAHAGRPSIVAQAGRLNAVTVATNMAGRGVDIILGGNPEGLARQEVLREGHDARDAGRGVQPAVPLERDARGVPGGSARRPRPATTSCSQQFTDECKAEGDKVRELGGLYVLGTERHESRRIDNQLRGRSGRQGDPGESRFYLSLDDELMRLFATGALQWVMGKALPDDEADRGQDGHQGHRAGAEHGRAAQRRDPQERPQVRRGDERAAQGDLPAPRPDPRGRRPAGRRRWSTSPTPSNH